MSINAAFEPGSRRNNRQEDSAFRGNRSQRLHPHYAGWCTPGPRPRERTLMPGVPGESSGLGAGVIPEGARKSIGGRGSGDGHLPSASQSNHFPNLLFCSAAARAWTRQRAPRSRQDALGSGIKLHHRLDYWLLNIQKLSNLFWKPL